VNKWFMYNETHWNFFVAMQKEAMRQVWVNNSNDHELCFDLFQQCYLMGGEL